MKEKYHVLVVEDDEQIRDGIEIYLKSQGYEVSKAADGIEGLEILKDFKHLHCITIYLHSCKVGHFSDRIQLLHIEKKSRSSLPFPVAK